MSVLILQPPLRGLDKARDRRTNSVTARRTPCTRTLLSFGRMQSGADWSSLHWYRCDIGANSLRPELPAQLSNPLLGKQGSDWGTLLVERQRGGSSSTGFGFALSVLAFSCWHASPPGISCSSNCCMSLWPYPRHYAAERGQYATSLHQNWQVIFVWMPAWPRQPPSYWYCKFDLMAEWKIKRFHL